VTQISEMDEKEGSPVSSSDGRSGTRVPARSAPPSFPPGPRAPAIVQLLRLGRDPLGYVLRLHRRYGDVFSVSFPSFRRLVYVVDPALVKEIFTGDSRGFHAGEANAAVLEPALGPHSVLTLDEDEHMRQRRLLLPPFHGESIRRYGELIREITEREIETWPVGRPFGLRPHTQRITLDVILRAVFGVRDPERFALAQRLVEEFARRSHPIVLFPVLRRRFGRFSPMARFQRARKALDEFIYEEIAIRRAEAASSDRDDVLSLLLQATHEDGSPMSDQELRDELVTVIGAGHETTATELAWAIERLVRTPRVLARLKQSLGAGEDEYLDAVIKETLRTRPVITDVARKLVAPAEIGGYSLPAGTYVLPAILAIHHREDLYPEPFRFRPERFLEGQGEGYAWIPFGGGVRRCIGAAFAQYEMRIVLELVLQRADLRADDRNPERLQPRNITLAPGRDARVVLERPLRPLAKRDAEAPARAA
jgi:cytochrome P450